MKALLNSRQVASRTGLDQSTVLKWARRFEFPGAKRQVVKGRWEWRFTVTSVRSFNARRKATRRG